MLAGDSAVSQECGRAESGLSAAEKKNEDLNGNNVENVQRQQDVRSADC